ncbi:MAG: prepilin-type N-terminal cleavage/methylation domain-containing protein [Candidatus Vogelbacteria bacterium]|nr:prepilin-type N-terminal cleavage/methylation domain-containing protein [Candidatus Vogelbacteria bacterium]
MLIKKRQPGFGLVEALVGAAIIAISTAAVLLAFSGGLKLTTRNTQNTRAGFLLTEGLEAARVIRDDGWDKGLGLWPSGTAYHLTFSGGTWATTTNNTFIDGLFDRTIIATQVYRDGNQDIASSGAVDPNTKKVTVNVAWRSGSATTTATLEAYLTNLFND